MKHIKSHQEKPTVGVTRVRSIAFFFEIKRFLVYNSTILKLTYFYAILFTSKRICRQKEFRKKVKKRSNCDRKSQLSEILTEPSNPLGQKVANNHINGYILNLQKIQIY